MPPLPPSSRAVIPFPLARGRSQRKTPGPATLHRLHGVRPIPVEHLRAIYADDSECVEDMLGDNPATWAEIMLGCIGFLALLIFLFALNSGQVPL